MYKNIFERNEQKYIVSAEQQNALLEMAGVEIEPDKYPVGINCNLYFDTPQNSLIIKAIDKPLYKQKVRLRSYGVPNRNGQAFLEAKVKYKGIVYKRRIQVNLDEFWKYYKSLPYVNTIKANKRSSPLVDSQIMRELDHLFQHYNLQPAWIICYDRESYRGKTATDLRITFDKNLRSRTDELRLEAGDHGQSYFTDDVRIMEIKVLGAMPLWLVHILSQLHVYPVSFTKYGNIYKESRKAIYVK